ncbi:hypothetical protein [Neobacillus soli]|uniref:hypothetical protein n=1 Tax=Neobacillus soli TaxID=220688 RepID=UPI000824A55B|nr:hypothetical protein [Neobacillus soli]
MIKKLMLVLLASVLFITGCQSIKGVNLNQMVINNSKIKSSESKTTASLELSYSKSQVKDKDLLKVLSLLNHMKVEIQTKMQNSNTVSLNGNVILQQGKIPFRVYVDKKQMVLQLDNASKPIRIPMDNGTPPNDKMIQDLQTKLIGPIVRNIPNPKHISVKSATEKVNGVKVKGHKIHAEVYADEVEKLLLTFLTNLSKDNNALDQIVTAVNEISKVAGDNSKMTAAELKEGLVGIQEMVKQSVPELKKSKVLTHKNYLKTDIFVDSKFFERKSSSVLNIAGIQDDSGVKGIRLKLTNETWNINKSVKAKKISASKYLKEDATEEQFLATLDKKHSVLYSVMTSLMYKPSAPLKVSQVKVSNNKRKADKVSVKTLKKGDVIKVYNASKGGKLLAAKQSSGAATTISISQLGKKSGKVYVSIIRSGKKAESTRVAIKFKGE